MAITVIIIIIIIKTPSSTDLAYREPGSLTSKCVVCE